MQASDSPAASAPYARYRLLSHADTLTVRAQHRDSHTADEGRLEKRQPTNLSCTSIGSERACLLDHAASGGSRSIARGSGNIQD